MMREEGEKEGGYVMGDLKMMRNVHRDVCTFPTVTVHWDRQTP
jgi:hypothetical protein